MKKTTRWHPDTCGCVLEYEWDDKEPEADREHTYARTVETCAAHKHLADDAAHFEAVNAENQGKNYALEAIAAAVPEQTELLKTRAGEVRQWKPGLEPAWDFDAERQLLIAFPGWSKEQQAAAEAAVAEVLAEPEKG